MNVIETIHNELKDKHLTDLERVRYIYVRCCQIFHFDSRWHYTSVWKDDELKKQIFNREIDLENVQDTSVVCRSGSIAAKTLCEAFTNCDCNLREGKNHTSLDVKIDGVTWNLDLAHGDLARGKIDLVLENFSCGANNEYRILDEVDHNLGLSFFTGRDYRSTIHNVDLVDLYRQIGYLINDSNARYHYTDANFFFTLMACTYIHEGSTYLDRDYNFHKLVKANDGEAYFDLSKDEDYYSVKEIEKDKYDYYVKVLKHK